MTTASDKRICVICAWRENCTKRYRVKSNALFDVNCADYTRDIKLREKDLGKLVEDEVGRWQKEKKGQQGYVITLSSLAGAGGGSIGRILATDLNIRLLGSELIQQVAESAHVSDKVIQSLDQKSISVLDNVIRSFFETRHIGPTEYIRHLSMVIHTLAQHGNVILIGRGANFILGDEAFRVRIIAPQEMRIANVIRDRPVPYEEAKKYVLEYDANQTAFVRKYFNEDITNPEHYDMMINMKQLNIESAADSIKKAFLEWKALRDQKSSVAANR
jgi:cytidylate kinase